MRTLRFRKNDPEHNVLAAVSNYIKARGGDVIVIGGIEVQRWPEDREMQYRLAVRVTGRPPAKEDQ